MKALIILGLSVALTACGSGDYTESNTSKQLTASNDVVQVQMPATDNRLNVSVIVEEPLVIVDTVVVPDVPMINRPIKPNNNEPFICTVDNNSLTDLGDYLVDNCGNKYGKVK